MTGSIIPFAIDRLVAILSAVEGLTVFDGPGMTDAALLSGVFIGWTDPDTTGSDESAVTDQVWPYLGHVQRDETAGIRCLAIAWNGDADMKGARDAVFGYLAEIGTTIQADPSLGLNDNPVAGIPLLYVDSIQAGTFSQNQDDTGAIAQLTFTINLHGRVN